MASAKSTQRLPDLETLVGLFYDRSEDLGEFQPVSSSELPLDQRRLLDHDEHMTETVEAFHGCPVDVRVLDRFSTGSHYARKILLIRRRDDEVVQFGIMRIAFASMGPEVRHEIESEGIPLGRVLINHDLMRQVRLSRLYRVRPGAELRRLMNVPENGVVYGRTAIIRLNGEPSVELLEIVSNHPAP